MNRFKKFARKWAATIVAGSVMFVGTYGALDILNGGYTEEKLEVVAGPQEEVEPIEVMVEGVGNSVESNESVVEESVDPAVSSVEGSVEANFEAGSDGVYYDVPLDKDLQAYIFDLCEGKAVDPAVVISMIGKESRFNSQAVGDGGRSLGLMQIQPRWHQWRMDEIFGVGNGDWMNPYQNVAVGVHILNDLYETGLSEEWVLMAYNGGYSYAHKMVAEGRVSDYVYIVLENSRNLERAV